VLRAVPLYARYVRTAHWDVNTETSPCKACRCADVSVAISVWLLLLLTFVWLHCPLPVLQAVCAVAHLPES
jgi:hypothetical protein